MQVKQILIGKTLVENNIFLAPMAGYTDACFRDLSLKNGYGFAFTELVSAKGLCYGTNGSKDLLNTNGNYAKVGAQLFGSDPYYLRSAIESEYIAPFNVVDINMGCPVPKIFKNGEGSALLGDIKKAETLIKECVKTCKDITVKIRTGLKKGDNVATDFAVMAEQSGAKLITIHGRVREDYYSGEPDYTAIAQAKKSVKISVIANGGIFTEEDAEKMFNETGADGIMIARGAIIDPTFAKTLLGEKPILDSKRFVIEHVKGACELYGESKALRELKKFYPYYFKGKAQSKRIRERLMAVDSASQVIEIIEQDF